MSREASSRSAEAGHAGLGGRAARGAFVTVGGQVIRIGIQVAALAVLARLLSPADYGLVAMVAVVVGVGEIFRDFGLSSAAVQAKTLSRHQRDNLFWINAGIGVLLATTVSLGADLVAALYDEPDLVPLARALSLTFVLNGLATQYRADHVRGMRFGHLATTDITAPIVAFAVAAPLAASGAGVWALVAQNLTQATTLLLMLAITARWLPGRPRRDPAMRDLLRFGVRLAGSQLIGYVSNNTDSFVIGLRLGEGPLGLYNRAFHLLMNPLNQLRAPSTTVALPVLSRLQDDDATYSTFIQRGQLALGYTLVVGLGIVAGAAEPITALFLGTQWAQVVPLLRLLAVAGAFQTLVYVGYWVYLSRNLTGPLFRYTLVTSTIRILCVVAGSHWGLVGVAVGYAVAPALAWPLSLWWLSRSTILTTRALATGALRILAVTALVGGAAYGASLAASDSASALAVLLAAVAGAAVVGLAGLVVPIVRRDLAEVVATARVAVHRPSRRGRPT